jgi:hypothetical protein
MSILRFEIDGVEFFINQETYETGLSIAGLARLCGIDRTAVTRLLKKLKTVVNKTPLKEAQTQASKAKTVVNKTLKSGPKGGRPGFDEDDLPECLQCLLDGDIYLDVENQYKNATILHEGSCAAILYYYAMHSEQKPEKAKQSLWTFQRMGFRGWVHEVTGWKPPIQAVPAAIKPLTRAEELGILPRHVEVKFDRHIIYNDLLNKEITAPMYRLYFYFLDCNLTKYEATTEEICKHARVLKHNLYDLVEKMYVYGLVPEWLDIDDSTRGIEARIRDRLHAELGGEIEVQTIYGPIDLLTATHLIEIKRIDDWKEGFGQLLVKCKKFPQHKLRLHLFGKSDRILRNIKARCKEFDITVTYEECLALV